MKSSTLYSILGMVFSLLYIITMTSAWFGYGNKPLDTDLIIALLCFIYSGVLSIKEE